MDGPLPVLGTPAPCRIQFGNVSFYCGPENLLLRDSIHRFHRLIHDGDELPLPLTFYGNHGSGKSLVVSGLVDVWKSLVTHKSVIVTTASDFRRALSNAIKTDDVNRLHKVHRSASLLVIEDIHQLAGKVLPQHWLIELIDERVRSARPTVFTCRKPIHKEHKLIERLKSRASSGLAVAIYPLRAETRRLVIDDCILSLNLRLSNDEISKLIASTAAASVPEIHAAVSALSWEPAKSSNWHAKSPYVPSSAGDTDLPRRILRETAKTFGSRVRDLIGPSRRKSVIVPRAVAMLLMRELTNMSLLEIGLHFRRRDHTTVLHACRKIKKKLPENPVLRESLLKIREALGIPLPSDWLESFPTSYCD